MARCASSDASDVCVETSATVSEFIVGFQSAFSRAMRRTLRSTPSACPAPAARAFRRARSNPAPAVPRCAARRLPVSYSRFDAREIDALELPQAQEHLLFERLRARDFLALLGRQPPCRWRDVCRRIVRVRPAPSPVEGMRPCAKTKIGLAPPIFQIVPRAKTRQRPVRNLVVLVAGRRPSSLHACS